MSVVCSWVGLKSLWFYFLFWPKTVSLFMYSGQVSRVSSCRGCLWVSILNSEVFGCLRGSTQYWMQIDSLENFQRQNFPSKVHKILSAYWRKIFFLWLLSLFLYSTHFENKISQYTTSTYGPNSADSWLLTWGLGGKMSIFPIKNSPPPTPSRMSLK